MPENGRRIHGQNHGGEPLRAALKQFEEDQFPERFAKFQSAEAAASTNPAPWQMCDVTSAAATSAALVLARDGAVRYVSNKTKDDTYTVKAVTYQRGLRAFRLDALADAGVVAKSTAIDSTYIKAQRAAFGGKGGARSRRSVARGAGGRPRSTRSPMSSAAPMS